MKEIPGKATFECEISKQNQKAEWRKGDSKISAGDKYTMSVDGGVHTLKISDVTDEDEDQYTVIFPDAKSTAKLNVQGKLCQSLSSVCLQSVTVCLRLLVHCYTGLRFSFIKSDLNLI